MNSPSHAFRRWFGSGTRSHRALAWTVLAILAALIPTLVVVDRHRRDRDAGRAPSSNA